jgi:hypothetical protein
MGSRGVCARDVQCALKVAALQKHDSSTAACTRPPDRASFSAPPFALHFAHPRLYTPCVHSAAMANAHAFTQEQAHGLVDAISTRMTLVATNMADGQPALLADGQVAMPPPFFGTLALIRGKVSLKDPYSGSYNFQPRKCALCPQVEFGSGMVCAHGLHERHEIVSRIEAVSDATKAANHSITAGAQSTTFDMFSHDLGITGRIFLHQGCQFLLTYREEELGPTQLTSATMDHSQWKADTAASIADRAFRLDTQQMHDKMTAKINRLEELYQEALQTGKGVLDKEPGDAVAAAKWTEAQQLIADDCRLSAFLYIMHMSFKPVVRLVAKHVVVAECRRVFEAYVCDQAALSNFVVLEAQLSTPSNAQHAKRYSERAAKKAGYDERVYSGLSVLAKHLGSKILRALCHDPALPGFHGQKHKLEEPAVSGVEGPSLATAMGRVKASVMDGALRVFNSTTAIEDVYTALWGVVESIIHRQFTLRLLWKMRYNARLRVLLWGNKVTPLHDTHPQYSDFEELLDYHPYPTYDDIEMYMCHPAFFALPVA